VHFQVLCDGEAVDLLCVEYVTCGYYDCVGGGGFCLVGFTGLVDGGCGCGRQWSRLVYCLGWGG
jgi:hypothetical protein